MKQRLYEDKDQSNSNDNKGHTNKYTGHNYIVRSVTVQTLPSLQWCIL